jgi:hypothetical protein
MIIFAVLIFSFSLPGGMVIALFSASSFTLVQKLQIPLLGVSAYKIAEHGTNCTASWHLPGDDAIYPILCVIAISMAALLMAVLYFQIFATVTIIRAAPHNHTPWSQVRKVAKATKRGTGSHGEMGSLAKKMLILVGFFFVCWAPCNLP